MCENGEKCIPESFVCDGSSDNGNADWTADCTDGSDEMVAMCCEVNPEKYGDDLCGAAADPAVAGCPNEGEW